jgi:hypothetical protein
LRAASYRTANGLAWCATDAGILVDTGGRKPPVRIAYPRAAIWDALARGGAPHDAAAAYAAATGPCDDAEGEVERAVREWAQAGLLVKDDRHG